MKTVKLLFAAVVTVTAFLICGPAHAEGETTYTYDAGDYFVKYDWTRASNWVGDHVPTAGANINMAGYGASYATGTVNNVVLVGGSIDVNGSAPGNFIIQGNVNGPGSINWFDINSNATFDNMGGTLSLATIYSNGFTPIFTGSGTTNFYLNQGASTSGVTLQSGILKGYGIYSGYTTINGGTFQASGSNTASTFDVRSGGTLTNGVNADIGIGGLMGAGAVQFTSGKALNVGYNNNNTTFSGSMINGAFGKYGSGTLTLSGENTFTGVTTVADGTLKLTVKNALGNTARVDLTKGVLEIAAEDAFNTAADVLIGYTGPAVLKVSANQKIANLSNTSPANSLIDLGAALNVKSGSYSGNIIGSGSLEKSGTGNLYLSGTNTYTGTTTVAQGVLQIAAISALPNNAVVTSGVDDSGGATSGTLYFGLGYTNPSFHGDISGTGGVSLRMGHNAYTLTHWGNSAWSGQTDVQIGTLILMNGIQTGSPVNLSYNNSNSNGTLDLSNASSTIGQVTGPGYILIGTKRLTIDIGEGVTNNMSANISGTTGGVTKTGSGTLSVGSLSYTGETTIREGTWVNSAPANSIVYVMGDAVYKAGSAAGLKGDGKVMNTGSFVLGSAIASSESFAGTIDIGTNTLTKSFSNTQTLTGDITAGGVSVNAGQLALNGAAFTGAVPPTFSTSSGSTLNCAAGNYTWGNVGSSYGTVNIGPAASVTMMNTSTVNLYGTGLAGTGTLNLNGALVNVAGSSTYRGTANVNAGTLRVSGSTGKAMSYANVNIGANGTLDLYNYSQTIGSLGGSGTLNTNGYSATVGANDQNSTCNINTTGSGGVTKIGTGEMTVTRAQTYTGNTTAKGGTLTVSGSGSLASQYNVIQSGGTLNLVNTLGTPMNMIGDTKYIDSYGGKLTIVQQGDAANTEKVGLFILRGGSNTNIAMGGTGTAGLSAPISRYALATLTYEDNGTNRLIVENQLTMTNDIVPWAAVKNPDGTYEFANTESGTLKAYSSAGKTYTASLASATSSSNVRLTNAVETVGAGTTKTINSLTVDGGADIQGAGTLSTSAMIFNGDTNIAASTLNIGSEGVLFANDNANVQIGATVAGTNYVQSGSGTVTFANAGNSYTGSTNVNDGTLIGDSQSINGTINNNGTVMFNDAVNATVSNALNGYGNYVKQGTGTTTFSASSSGTGDMFVESGIAKITGSMSGMDVFAVGGTVIGTGQIATLILDDPGVYSPGASPGQQTAYRSVWDGGGTYLWEINNATGSVGTNWDLLNVTDQIAITATPTDKLIIDITSLDMSNVINPCANFSSTTDYASGWKIASAAGGIVGFSQDVFQLVIDDFKNTGVSLSDFYIYQSGNDIKLAYMGGSAATPTGYAYTAYTPIGDGWWTEYAGSTPIDPGSDVPEPSTLLLLLPFIGFGLKKMRAKKV
jgi:autotransporter-associated beta strand protein